MIGLRADEFYALLNDTPPGLPGTIPFPDQLSGHRAGRIPESSRNLLPGPGFRPGVSPCPFVGSPPACFHLSGFDHDQQEYRRRILGACLSVVSRTIQGLVPCRGCPPTAPASFRADIGGGTWRYRDSDQTLKHGATPSVIVRGTHQ